MHAFGLTSGYIEVLGPLELLLCNGLAGRCLVGDHVCGRVVSLHMDRCESTVEPLQVWVRPRSHRAQVGTGNLPLSRGTYRTIGCATL